MAQEGSGQSSCSLTLYVEVGGCTPTCIVLVPGVGSRLYSFTLEHRLNAAVHGGDVHGGRERQKPDQAKKNIPIKNKTHPLGLPENTFYYSVISPKIERLGVYWCSNRLEGHHPHHPVLVLSHPKKTRIRATASGVLPLDWAWAGRAPPPPPPALMCPCGEAVGDKMRRSWRRCSRRDPRRFRKVNRCRCARHSHAQLENTTQQEAPATTRKLISDRRARCGVDHPLWMFYRTSDLAWGSRKPCRQIKLRPQRPTELEALSIALPWTRQVSCTSTWYAFSFFFFRGLTHHYRVRDKGGVSSSAGQNKNRRSGRVYGARDHKGTGLQTNVVSRSFVPGLRGLQGEQYPSTKQHTIEGLVNDYAHR